MPAANTATNVLLAWPNYADPQLDPSRTIVPTVRTPVFSGGSWLGSMPLANLATSLLYEKARSTNALAASTTFTVDMQVARNVLCLALVRHNLSPNATVRLRASDDGATWTKYDSGAIAVWGYSAYPPGSLPFGYPELWTGKPTAEDVAIYPSLAFTHVLPTMVSARYWRVDIVDTANPHGYVELGRLFLGPGFIPRINVTWGASWKWTTGTTSERSKGGVDFFDEEPARRTWRGAWDDMHEDQAFAFWFEALGRMGKHQQMFFCYNPADTHHMHRRSMLCTHEELDAITAASLDHEAVGLSLTEVL